MIKGLLDLTDPEKPFFIKAHLLPSLMLNQVDVVAGRGQILSAPSEAWQFLPGEGLELGSGAADKVLKNLTSIYIILPERGIGRLYVERMISARNK